MKINTTKSAFTLVEVMVAASILSVTIFGVYKLIGENTKLISNSEQYSFANTLFPSLQECIEYIWTGSFLSPTGSYYFDFWDGTQCNHWTTPTNITLDNIDYILSGSYTQTPEQIEWLLEVSSDTTKPITKTYTQLK